MSENENKPPSKQTSSVPLKKETVRVTLKAADAPPAVPSATLPATPAPVVPKPLVPPTPTAGPVPPVPMTVAPSAPRPVPAPTIPLKTAGAPAATKPGAPTIKLATTNAPVGAPTIALKTANAPLPGSGAPTIPLKTANAPLPGGDAGKPTAVLPKATVALNPPTKPLTPTGAAATQKTSLTSQVEEEDESGANTFVKILAGVGFVAALVVLGLQLKMANVWIDASDQERQGDWSLLIE